jgi:hypothetical protein
MHVGIRSTARKPHKVLAVASLSTSTKIVECGACVQLVLLATETGTQVARGMLLRLACGLYQEVAARTMGGPGFPWMTSVPITICKLLLSSLKPVRLQKACMYCGSVRNRPAAMVP